MSFTSKESVLRVDSFANHAVADEQQVGRGKAGATTSLHLGCNMWKSVYVVAVLAVLFMVFRDRAKVIR